MHFKYLLVSKVDPFSFRLKGRPGASKVFGVLLYDLHMTYDLCVIELIVVVISG